MSIEFGTTDTDRTIPSRVSSRQPCPRVSVVIPVRDAKDLLDEQLDALLCQRGVDEQIEVVVVDNKSQDGLREHITAHPRRGDLQLHYVCAAAQDGASYARNTGVKHASGEILAFCDADDVVHSDWLSTLLSALESTDIAGTAVETARLNTPKIRESVPAIEPENQGKTSFLPFVMAGSFACRKQTYLDLGGMHEGLIASEDVEFSWRAQLSGYSLELVPTELVSYRLRTDKRAMAKQAMQLGIGSAQLQKLYRPLGCPGVSVWKQAYELLALLAVRPLVPTNLISIKKDVWIRSYNGHLGMIQGTVRRRRKAWTKTSMRSAALD